MIQHYSDRFLNFTYSALCRCKSCSKVVHVTDDNYHVMERLMCDECYPLLSSPPSDPLRQSTQS